MPGTIKAHQDALQDNSRFPALIAHSGTAGTALTRRVTSQNTPGALDTHIAGGTVLQSKVSTGTWVNGTVTNANTLIAASNANRISIAMTHEGTTDLYLGLGTGVTAGSTGNGIPIMANQFYIQNDYTGAIYGIVSAGSTFTKYIEY